MLAHPPATYHHLSPFAKEANIGEDPIIKPSGHAGHKQVIIASTWIDRNRLNFIVILGRSALLSIRHNANESKASTQVSRQVKI